MKLLYVFAFFAVLVGLASSKQGSTKPGTTKQESSKSATIETKLVCEIGDAVIKTKWVDMMPTCTGLLEKQIKQEMTAALTYLAMGAHFARDTVSRPGFSKFFFEAANEEREHAIKVIEYLLMRGGLTGSTSSLLNFAAIRGSVTRKHWNGLDALEDALKLETDVTKSIRNITTFCETADDFNDYHAVDYFTEDFLDEQYKGQRDLAGKLTTLSKMKQAQGELGEFLFDKKLLYGEI